jgi:diguanylate cyclase (GGDEF)-like protein
LQTAVNEVGATLGVECCTILIEAGSLDEELLVVRYFRQKFSLEEVDTIDSDLGAYRKRLRNNPQPYVRDGLAKSTSTLAEWADKPLVVIPLLFLEQFVGVLFVRDDKPTRIWQENEILLLETVADQVAIAVNHARLYVKSQQEALRDSLTGVFNRRFFEMQFEREINLAQRTEQNLSLIIADIDRFKSVNDTFGHAVGDDVLKEVARVLKTGLRNFDTLARYGGEEFVMILPQTTAEGAMVVADRLRQTLADTNIADVGQVTASFGVATFPDHAKNGSELRTVADRALYHAKRNGRNRVSLSVEENNKTLEPPFPQLSDSDILSEELLTQ